jgi:hypothetical protein
MNVPLSDGRSLCVREYGDPAGRPVLGVRDCSS